MSFNVFLSEKLIESMKQQKIDIELTERILSAINAGAYTASHVTVKNLPAVDNTRILDIRGDLRIQFTQKKVSAAIERFPELQSIVSVPSDNAPVELERGVLHEAGLALIPYVAYGILNGGSATSYVDRKKNAEYNPAYFNLVKPAFDALYDACAGKPKGVTPGFIQPDGAMGPSYLELKIRALLLQLKNYRDRGGKPKNPHLSLFQMTNIVGDGEIQQALETYAHSPFITDLLGDLGLRLKDIKTGVQPLIAAFTHISKGDTRFIFSGAYGKRLKALPLPAGHGQNFRILRPVYESLYREGKRFIYLTNVDNLGACVDPVSVALLALSGKQAGFDFSFKSPFDTKGGILVRDENDKLTCADLGAAVSLDRVRDFESAGAPILFNCATGLFDLAYLVENIDAIIENLPLRLSEQNKEAGLYSQAEWITWEVLGLLDDFFVFAVEKNKRFLPAKLLLENFMASGIGLPEILKGSTEVDETTASFIQGLNEGLKRTLEDVYGLQLSLGGDALGVSAQGVSAQGVWRPKIGP